MELPNADEDLHNVDSTDEIEDPNIVHIGVIGDTVSSGCPSLSLCLSLSVCLSLSLFMQEVTLGFLLVGIGYHLHKFCNYLLVERSSYNTFSSRFPSCQLKFFVFLL